MRKIILVRVNLLILLVFISFFKISAQEQIQWRSFQAAVESQKTSNKPIYVFLFANWDEWTQKFVKETLSNQEIVRYLNKEYIPVSFNVHHACDIEFNGKIYTTETYNHSCYQSFSKVLSNVSSIAELKFPTHIILNEEINYLTVSPGFFDEYSFYKMLNYFGEGKYLITTWDSYKIDRSQLDAAQNSPVVLPANWTYYPGNEKNYNCPEPQNDLFGDFETLMSLATIGYIVYEGGKFLLNNTGTKNTSISNFDESTDYYRNDYSKTDLAQLEIQYGEWFAVKWPYPNGVPANSSKAIKLNFDCPKNSKYPGSVLTYIGVDPNGTYLTGINVCGLFTEKKLTSFNEAVQKTVECSCDGD